MNTISFTHASHHKWIRDITSQNDPLVQFGTKTRNKIRKAKKLLEQSDYIFTIADLTQAFLDNFLTIYDSFIDSINGTHFNVRGYLENNPYQKVYKSLALQKHNKLKGAVIFGLADNTLSIAYRVFPHNLLDIKLPISTSYVADSLITEFALGQKITTLYHGRDRNPYGIYSSPGLANYKLHSGFTPSLETLTKYETRSNIQWNGITDVYALGLPTSGTVITHALFLSTKPEEELKSKYPSLFSPEAPVVTIKNS